MLAAHHVGVYVGTYVNRAVVPSHIIPSTFLPIRPAVSNRIAAVGKDEVELMDNLKANLLQLGNRTEFTIYDPIEDLVLLCYTYPDGTYIHHIFTISE